MSGPLIRLHIVVNPKAGQNHCRWGLSDENKSTVLDLTNISSMSSWPSECRPNFSWTSNSFATAHRAWTMPSRLYIFLVPSQLFIGIYEDVYKCVTVTRFRACVYKSKHSKAATLPKKRAAFACILRAANMDQKYCSCAADFAVF